MYNTLFSFKFLRGVASGLPNPVPSHSCYNRVLDNLMLRLFCCKIFFITKYFQMKMIFFFSCIWLHSGKCFEKYFTVLCER